MFSQVCLSLVVALMIAPQVRAAGTAGGDAQTLMKEVVSAMENLDALAMSVAYSGPSMPPDAISLEVLMSRGGKFRVGVMSSGREIAGMLSDGTEVAEWDARSNVWTKYPVSQRADDAPTGVRMLQDAPGELQVTFPITRYAGSWVTRPSAYQWFLQRMQQADQIGAEQGEVAGRSAVTLVAMQEKASGPITVVYSVKCSYDARSKLPALEEILASVKDQPGASESGYHFQYNRVVANPPVGADAFKYVPGAGMSFVDPQKIRPTAALLVGQSIKDWTVAGADGRPISVAEQIGSRPLVIVTWATWCIPCKEELLALSQLVREDEFAGVNILAVNTDADLRRFNAFVRDTQWPFRFARDTDFSARLGAAGVPATAIVSVDGIISALWSGWGGPDSADRLRAALRECLRAR
jgi:peroxiredoxin